MKKITLTALLLFVIISGAIYLSGLMSGSAPAPIVATTIHPPILGDAATPPATDPSGLPIFTTQEVSARSSPGDCYLIVNNNVYDVSSYINFHPGGSRQITSRCGKEVAGIFARIHSNRAWDLLGRYKIGVLETASAKTTNTVNVDLNTVEEGLKKANPNAEIISVRPKNDFYVAKVIEQSKLYEVRIDARGRIIKEEVESDEFDWSTWSSDADDN